MLEKVKEFIIHADCIGEFDKYFWYSRLPSFDEPTLKHIYNKLLEAENELLSLELKAIKTIGGLIEQTYPELKDKYLPNYEEEFNQYLQIAEELNMEQIQSLKQELVQSVNQ
jgi:hypothetical protein